MARAGRYGWPHRAHRLHYNLTPVQEMIVVELHRLSQLPLDDLLVIIQEALFKVQIVPTDTFLRYRGSHANRQAPVRQSVSGEQVLARV